MVGAYRFDETRHHILGAIGSSGNSVKDGYRFSIRAGVSVASRVGAFAIRTSIVESCAVFRPAVGGGNTFRQAAQDCVAHGSPAGHRISAVWQMTGKLDGKGFVDLEGGVGGVGPTP
jgi:hypothetical protein